MTDIKKSYFDPTRSPGARRLCISVNRVGAEGMSFVGWYGSEALASTLAPDAMQSLKCGLAKIIEAGNIPGLTTETYSLLSDQFPALEGQEYAKKRRCMSHSELAKAYADMLVDYGMLKFPAGYVGQMATQAWLDHKVGLPNIKLRSYGLSFAVDKAVNLGSILVLNKVCPDVADSMRRGLSGFLTAILGMEKEKANTYAGDMINILGPNTLGMAASVYFLDKPYAKAMEALGQIPKVIR